MPIIWTVLRATAVLGSLMAALVTGGIAHADTTPSVPGLGDLGAAVANAPQILQNFGSALGVLPPPAPVAPPPLAGASITMPQSPAVATAPSSVIPGTNAGIPGINSVVPQTPATAARPSLPGMPAAPSSSSALPSAQLDLPQVPFLPVPLPKQVSLPGALTSLAPGGVPLNPGALTGPALVGPAAAPVMSTNPLLAPLSALP